MPKLRAELIANLDTPEGLRTALQNAIELEHATIPTYLYAMFSINPSNTTNSSIHDLIFSIVIEEMLHMGLACNILNAIGGSPAIDTPGFIPTYPGPLPGSVEEGLIVPLAPFSYDLVQNVFMVIEEPEDPQNFPVKTDADALTPPNITIGEFYDAIKAALFSADPSIWVTDHSKQVTLSWMPLLTEVTDANSAAAAIDLIVGQGEGTSIDPMEPGSSDEPAHYYRFEEIVKGYKLVADPNSPLGYSYSGQAIPFDSAGVFNAMENPKLDDFLPETTPAWMSCNTFNTTYTSLLKCLHTTFNGSPSNLADAINMMPDLTKQAGVVMSIRRPDGTTAGPSFEYQPDAPNPCETSDA
jgi:hypothetical protein